MGHMTTIAILNDCFDQMEKNPQEVIEKIGRGMNGVPQYGGPRKKINYFSIGNCSSPLIVAASHHADDYRLFMTGGNMLSTFGYFNELTDLELRKSLLKRAKEILKKEEEEIKKLEQEQL